jgi:hypothetical protein
MAIHEADLNWPAAEFDEIEVKDRLAVLDRMARYSWAIDAGNLQDYLACFTSDAVLRHPLRDGSPGEFRGHQGISDFIGKGFSERSAQTYAHQHHFSAVLMKPDGADIRVKAHATIFRHEFQRQYWPSCPSFRMGSWYATFGGAEGGWKIREIDVRMWTDSVFGIGTAYLDRGPGMPGLRG